MKILVLSHFDQVLGPVPFLYTPEDVNKEMLAQISELIDLSEKFRDFFVHNVMGFQSANQFIKIPNPIARGQAELVLLSIILTDNDINIELSNQILSSFAQEMQKIPDLYKAFYSKNSKIDGSVQMYEELKELFRGFYDSIPIERVVQNRRDARIFIYGLSKAGKSTIIKQLQNAKNIDTIPTTNVGISRVFMNNLSFLTYDAPGQTKFRNLWSPYLKFQDSLVFVFDVADKDKYMEANRVLHEIANQEPVKNKPLLVLLNKSDKEQPNIEQMTNFLEINKFVNRPTKVYSTCGIENRGIDEAFQWLSQELSNRIIFNDFTPSNVELQEGIIFSRWDENSGLELLDVYPHDAIPDPETIAIQCFSMAELIYGGEKFNKQTSFVLPIAHLKANAAIYFDFIEDSSIRGGKLPLCLIILIKEDSSIIKIESIHNFVFKKFAEIKLMYQQNSLFQKNLSEIYLKLREIETKPEREFHKKISKMSMKINEFLKKF